MENSSKTETVVVSLLVGAAVGGILGMLFAPNKGSKTRKKLMRKQEELSKTIKSEFSHLIDEAKSEYKESKAKVNEIIENNTSVKSL